MSNSYASVTKTTKNEQKIQLKFLISVSSQNFPPRFNIPDITVVDWDQSTN